MNRLLVLLLFVTISLCALNLAMGQGRDFKSLKDKAENAVKSRRPDWTIKSKDEEEKEVIYNWNTRGFNIPKG